METTCILAWTAIGLLLLVFLWLAVKSNMLRDRVDDLGALQQSLPPGRTALPISKIPLSYSLARSQVAVWTLVIACSMIYLFFCRGCEQTQINATALALMGISLGTTAAAGLVDNSQIQAAAYNPALPPRHQNQVSVNFFYDILTDENGVSIHRFQNVVWTLISMGIYIYLVAHGNTTPAGTAQDGCLPDLDPTLLVLQGLSSAGYIGLKMNENGNGTQAGVSAAAIAAAPASGMTAIVTPAPATVTVTPGAPAATDSGMVGGSDSGTAGGALPSATDPSLGGTAPSV